jgi:hypothetical protein
MVVGEEVRHRPRNHIDYTRHAGVHDGVTLDPGSSTAHTDAAVIQSTDAPLFTESVRPTSKTTITQQLNIINIHRRRGKGDLNPHDA